MNKPLLIYLSIIMLTGAGIIGLTSFSSQVQAPATGIIIEDADYVANKTTEYSADLIDVAENVTPRTVVEYGDYISKLGLYKSDDLNEVAIAVTARIIVEYADSITELDLQGSHDLVQAVTTVTPRIIVEYADSILSTDLERPSFCGAEAGPESSVFSGELVTFNGSGSYDLDGTIVNYRWSFGDGTTAEGRIVSHRFRGVQNEPKTYTVTLTVEDDLGGTDTDTVYVTVAPLEKTVEISEPPILAKMTPTYNWIDKSNGEDIYIISKIHVEAEGFVGVFVPTIWEWKGLLPSEIFYELLFVTGGKAEKTYVYPFSTKPIIGKEPPIVTQTFYEGTFKGIQVKGTENLMSIHAQGFTLKLWPPWEIKLDVELLEFAAEHFVPHAPPVEPGLLQQLLDKLLDLIADLDIAHLGSSGELRVYDAQERVTGLVNGEVKEGIPNSVYFNNTVMTLSSNSSYRYEVVGTEDGSYELLVASFVKGESYNFTATDIPISTNAVHQYTIDWSALSQREEGITVKVDTDGDGAFEKTFSSDSELTHDEFMLHFPPAEAFPIWIVGVAVTTIAIATAAIAVFWRRRKQTPTKDKQN